MRRPLAVAGALLGAAVLGVLALNLVLNRVLASRVDEIVAGISDGFGRPATVGRVTTGFRGGMAVELHDVEVAEDPAFGTEPFLRTRRVYAVVRLVPLLRGRFEVRRLVAVEPELRIVRTTAGLNVDSVGRRRKDPSEPDRPDAPASRRREAARTAAIAIALVNLEGATLHWIDRTGPEPKQRTVSPLDLRLTDVSPTEPVGYDLRATVEGTSPTTVRVYGTVGPVGDPPFATDVPLEQHVTIEREDVVVPDVTLTGTLRRDESGRPVANLRLTAETIESPRVTVSDLAVAAREQEQTATVDQLSLRVFDGTVTGTGRVAHAVSPLALAFETTVRDVDVTAVATAGGQDDVRLRGRLDADWSLTAAGDDERAIRRSLAGNADVVIRNGAVQGINLPEGVLSGLTSLAGIVNLVPPKIRNRYPDIFATDDTRFDRLTAHVRIGDQRMTIDSLVVTAPDFEVRGAGTITYTRKIDLSATLSISAALWSDIVGALKEVSVLGGADGRLTIPFRVTGQVPDVRVKPDDAFVQRAMKSLVGSVLGTGARSGKKATKDAEDLIRKGLDKLLR